MLHLKYQLSPEEYFEFNYFTMWSAPHRLRYRISYYFKILLLYLAVAVLYISMKKSHNRWVDLAVFGVVAIAYFSLIPFLIRRSIRKRTENLLSQPENQHIIGDCEVILQDTGILDRDDKSETFYKWEGIVKRAETPRSYFLYTNSHHAIVIPKRTLQGKSDQQELNRLLDAHLPLDADL